MLYLLYNLKILENTSISEKYRKTTMGRNWSKFTEITVSTDVIISHIENTLHLLYSLPAPRQYRLYRQSSPSGFPSSYFYKRHKSTLDFQLVFPFLKIFVSFYHWFFFVFRLTFAFCPLGLVPFFIFFSFCPLVFFKLPLVWVAYNYFWFLPLFICNIN